MSTQRTVTVSLSDLELAMFCLGAAENLMQIVVERLEYAARDRFDAETLSLVRSVRAEYRQAKLRLAQYHPDRRQ